MIALFYGYSRFVSTQLRRKPTKIIAKHYLYIQLDEYSFFKGYWIIHSLNYCLFYWWTFHMTDCRNHCSLSSAQNFDLNRQLSHCGFVVKLANKTAQHDKIVSLQIKFHRPLNVHVCRKAQFNNCICTYL